MRRAVLLGLPCRKAMPGLQRPGWVFDILGGGVLGQCQGVCWLCRHGVGFLEIIHNRTTLPCHIRFLKLFLWILPSECVRSCVYSCLSFFQISLYVMYYSVCAEIFSPFPVRRIVSDRIRLVLYTSIQPTTERNALQNYTIGSRYHHMKNTTLGRKQYPPSFVFGPKIFIILTK